MGHIMCVIDWLLLGGSANQQFPVSMLELFELASEAAGNSQLVQDTPGSRVQEQTHDNMLATLWTSAGHINL